MTMPSPRTLIEYGVARKGAVAALVAGVVMLGCSSPATSPMSPPMDLRNAVATLGWRFEPTSSAAALSVETATRFALDQAGPPWRLGEVYLGSLTDLGTNTDQPSAIVDRMAYAVRLYGGPDPSTDLMLMIDATPSGPLQLMAFVGADLPPRR